MKKLLLYIFLFITVYTQAQTDSIPKDTLTFAEHFTEAEMHLKWRTFFMSTINQDSLKDDYSLAMGIGMGFLSRPYHGFQVGADAFFSYNLASSNITALEPHTNQPNRYELGLYDLQNPGKKYDVPVLQKLFIKYTFLKNNYIAVGRIDANHPFLNPQDGRMRPTAQEGVDVNISIPKVVGLQGAYYWTMSPRSTTQWNKVGDVVGIYPSGVTINGAPSNYYGNIKSAGLAVFRATTTFAKRYKLSFWNGHFFNVMNTAMLHLYTTDIDKRVRWGMIYIHQDAVKDGGNTNQAKTYINKGAQSNVLSGHIGYRTGKVSRNGFLDLSANYTFISGDGRFLMPREWGRDWLYTFMPRERNEGLGGVNAATTKIAYEAYPLSTSVSYGYFNLPDVKNFRLNKYGMPSYHQINIDFTYDAKFLKGLKFRFLAACKINAGETYNNPRFVYNKVNIVNFNLVVDYNLPEK